MQNTFFLPRKFCLEFFTFCTILILILSGKEGILQFWLLDSYISKMHYQNWALEGTRLDFPIFLWPISSNSTT